MFNEKMTIINMRLNIREWIHVKIDITSLSAISNIQGAKRVVKPYKPATGQSADGINVSDKGQLFQTLLQKAKEVPEIREDRVKEVANRIQNGQFTIDAQLIANRLLEQNNLLN